MTSFFPDLNVWLALSVDGHEHNHQAWTWMERLPKDARLVFSRHTQIGLLRLLVSPSVMGDEALVLRKAWNVYDRWLEDRRVQFYPEPRDADGAFRQVSSSFGSQKAAKAVGDCWLLAYAMEIGAALVTFDRALYELSRKQGHTAVVPG